MKIEIPDRLWNSAKAAMVRSLKEDFVIADPDATLRALVVDVFKNDMREAFWDGVADHSELKKLGLEERN